MRSQSSQYDSLYHPAERWVVVNEDDDLTPIYISTPPPPPLHLIDGYGEHPDDQIFKRKEVPRRLKDLEKHCFSIMYDVEKANKQETVQGYRVYQKFWDKLEESADDYEEEIKWIKNIWWWRTHGYWCFIDGTPTYITGDYFDFLNFWYIKEAETYPDFREEDRIGGIFSNYLENTTETFADIDMETGRAIKGEDGKYRMKDIGSRVFFGDQTPKFRRCGETHLGLHKVWKGTSTTSAAYGTIISMEGENAQKHYTKKMLPAWNAYPLFLKPIWVGSKRPTQIKLAEPPNVYHIEGLGSLIDYTDSAGVSKNDGDRLNFSLCDEEGKTKQSVVFERWNVNKVAMSTGGGTNIIGYSKHPSTVEEMSEGGLEYFKMGQLSCFYERMPITGQTFSGLARRFYPAFKKLEGYVDKFGKSVVDAPTERQIRLRPHAKFAITGKGAKETLQAELDSLLAKGTPEALEQYRSRRRKFPMRWSDCWLGSSGNVGFNLEIVDARLAEINKMKSFGKQPYKTGSFYREGNNENGRVLWRTDLDNGKFKMSMDMVNGLDNRKMSEMIWDSSRGAMIPMWRPVGGDAFTCGADPFRYMNKTEVKSSYSNSRQSDGGIVIVYEDGKGGTDVVLTYRNRPASQREYMEDVLMACQYYSCMCYPENNVEDLIKHFIERNYGGYLLYSMDAKTGRLKEKPGEFTSSDNKVSYFTAVKDYIQFFGSKCNHDDLLVEIKNIKGLDDLNSKDLLAAFCLALRGTQTRYRQVIQAMNNTNIDLRGVGMFKKRCI
jgi:hypothetical protein